MNTQFDFETMVDRTGTGNMKGSFAAQMPETADPLILAGAEMDYATAPVIREALEQFARRGIYGFTLPDEPYLAAVCGWMQRVRGAETAPEEIVVTQGTIKGVTTAVRAFTAPGDGVIIQHPSYYRFDAAVEKCGRKVVSNPMRVCDGHYEIDFADLEEKMSVSENRLMILCNPHNPTGKVFSRSELEQIARLANRLDMTVLSDEIFAETAQPGYEVTPYTEADRHGIVSSSFGKCFNFTGVNHANLIIPDETLRNRYLAQRNREHFGSIDPFFYTAVLAGYSQEGYDWIRAMNRHTQDNYRVLLDMRKESLPEITVSPLEGSFVAWLDMSGLGMTDEQMNQWLVSELGVMADPGHEYGPGGENHIRLNLATPSERIREFTKRLIGRKGTGKTI